MTKIYRSDKNKVLKSEKKVYGKNNKKQPKSTTVYPKHNVSKQFPKTS